MVVAARREGRVARYALNERGAALVLGVAVDVAREERHERCVALQDGLRQTSSRLQELAAGKGRPAQLSARLLKSLEKCGGAGRAVDARAGVGTDR